MLDDYCEKQEMAYNLMINEIKKDHISHAYLIDENNYSKSFDMVIAFIKEILGSKLNGESAKIIRKRIDDGNYPEIKVIEPDGMLIKKQQILDLQQEFSRAAVEGSKRFYIIREADKMRNETANSMLKFLEEPDNDIMAILMTNNFNSLLPTIVSRCQVIRLNNDGNNTSDLELEKVVLAFILELEKHGLDVIMKEQELLFSHINIKERDKFIYFFDKMIDMYYDILKILSGNQKITFNDNLKELNEIASKNDQAKILDKINILLELKDTIKNNVNINLLIDSLIVRVGGM